MLIPFSLSDYLNYTLNCLFFQKNSTLKKGLNLTYLHFKLARKTSKITSHFCTFWDSSHVLSSSVVTVFLMRLRKPGIFFILKNGGIMSSIFQSFYSFHLYSCILGCQSSGFFFWWSRLFFSFLIPSWDFLHKSFKLWYFICGNIRFQCHKEIAINLLQLLF